jgi:hypothetical protein
LPRSELASGVQLAGEDGLAALAQAVAPLDIVLALDNAEHLHAGLAFVVVALREAAPRVRLLVTSQVPLRARGEHLYRLSGLAWPEETDAGQAMAYGAVALFVERARAVDPALRPNRRERRSHRGAVPRSTACRSPSSSPPRDCRCLASRRWQQRWTSACACSPSARQARRRDRRPCAPP